MLTYTCIKMTEYFFFHVITNIFAKLVEVVNKSLNSF